MKASVALLSSLAVIALAHAQSNNGNNGKKPDEQWDDVVKLTTPASSNGNGNGNGNANGHRTQTQIAADKAAAANSARQAAAAAKSFYLNNPTHVYAKDARKLEAAQSLLGVVDGDASYEAGAQQTARAYRT